MLRRPEEVGQTSADSNLRGSPSTGKTTLCEVLAKRLGLESAAYVREVARRIMREKGYSRDTIADLKMQLEIMEGHIEDEERAIGAANLVLCDRSAIDPIVYAILDVAKQRQSTLLSHPAFERALGRYCESASIFILLAPVKSWVVDDGVRSIENQEECSEVFIQVLRDLGIPYRVLGSDCQSVYERMVLTLGQAYS
ncbi:AAA domain-containing protein [Ephemerocybe angulata]|uniref:AAA domain-containing protein n=1 Tax=Ephemerocybe angulata TaxID=980116 RepID=A0A8H6HXJ4_9AGAR|nr:AAA domain-containing protein [Tulosesus angulatus]